MRYKWIAAALGAAVLAGSLCGCGEEKRADTVLNYTAPEQGDQIVVMTIAGYGDVTFRMFPDVMPKAVENFVSHAENGYYDGVIFHRVIADFMLQGGDPTGTGRGGESIWGGKFDGGTSSQLIHVPGALCYANSGGTATDDSQFYVVTGTEGWTDEALDSYQNNALFEANYGYQPSYSADARELYKQYGGTPHLDGGYTVFGQVIDGLDIIYALSYADTDDNNRPLEDIVIEKMTVTEYDGSEIRFYKSDYTME